MHDGGALLGVEAVEEVRMVSADRRILRRGRGHVSSLGGGADKSRQTPGDARPPRLRPADIDGQMYWFGHDLWLLRGMVMCPYP